ncbi:hypothetical protein QYE76_062274 [Lolium multiflorum]|uniref:Reverse transcriptase zinc-binding domain-containing protein n=1 Tax=Lolium multiflorum TaxID=4521 RepID=A0AAD8S3A4_LOLMU|nr:hypothetical protein QYE76_062274 [Lolium multiflorum]
MSSSSDVELVVHKEKLHKPKVQHKVHDVPSVDVGDLSAMPVDDKPVLVGDKPDEANPIVDDDVAACATVPVCVDASIQTDDVCADSVSVHMAQMRVGGVGGERVNGDSGQRHYRARGTAVKFSATPRMHRGKDGRSLPTNERRFRHHLGNSGTCLSYPRDEDTDHLLLRCPQASEVWRFFHRDFDNRDYEDLLDFWLLRCRTYEEATINTAIAWSIWKRRNTLTINDIIEDISVVTRRFLEDIRLWAIRCTTPASSHLLNSWCNGYDPP